MIRSALLLVLLPCSALGQEPFLLATPTECAGLEGLVTLGLIDGGEGGDTSALTEIVRSGDGAACAAELSAQGFGDGLAIPSCREALDLVAANGPPSPEGDRGALLYDLLTGASPEACELTVAYYRG